MKQITVFIAIISILFFASCRKDFETVQNTGRLGFSKDTVYLDTVFTNIGSSTYNLKVYNHSSEDIYIPSIRLGRGNNSNYRINVDGIPGKSFENIEIFPLISRRQRFITGWAELHGNRLRLHFFDERFNFLHALLRNMRGSKEVNGLFIALDDLESRVISFHRLGPSTASGEAPVRGWQILLCLLWTARRGIG